MGQTVYDIFPLDAGISAQTPVSEWVLPYIHQFE
jgi:hypothetical protein